MHVNCEPRLVRENVVVATVFVDRVMTLMTSHWVVILITSHWITQENLSNCFTTVGRFSIESTVEEWITIDRTEEDAAYGQHG